MSESVPQPHESLKKHKEVLELKHEAAPKQERKTSQTEHEELPHDHNLDKIHQSIHKEAISGKEVTVGEKRQDSNQPVIGMQRELKLEAYHKTMRRVRRHLNPAEQRFSKFVHSGTMEPLSELGAK